MLSDGLRNLAEWFDQARTIDGFSTVAAERFSKALKMAVKDARALENATIAPMARVTDADLSDPKVTVLPVVPRPIPFNERDGGSA